MLGSQLKFFYSEVKIYVKYQFSFILLSVNSVHYSFQHVKHEKLVR